MNFFPNLTRRDSDSISVRSSSSSGSDSLLTDGDDESIVSAAPSEPLESSRSSSLDSSNTLPAASPRLAPARFVVRTGGKDHSFNHGRQEFIKERFALLGATLKEASKDKENNLKLDPSRFAIVFQPGKDRSVRLVQKDNKGVLRTILPNQGLLELINKVDNVYVKTAYEELIEAIIESDTTETVEGKLAKEEKSPKYNNVSVEVKPREENTYTVTTDDGHYNYPLTSELKAEREKLVKEHALYPFHEYLGKDKRQPETYVGMDPALRSRSNSIASESSSKDGDEDSDINSEIASFQSKDGSYKGSVHSAAAFSPLKNDNSHDEAVGSLSDSLSNLREEDAEALEGSLDNLSASTAGSISELNQSLRPKDADSFRSSQDQEESLSLDSLDTQPKRDVIDLAVKKESSFPALVKEKVEIDPRAEQEFRDGLDQMLDADEKPSSNSNSNAFKKRRRKKIEASANTAPKKGSSAQSKTYNPGEGDALDKLVVEHCNISPYSTLAATDSPEFSESEEDDKIQEMPKVEGLESQEDLLILQDLQKSWNDLNTARELYAEAIKSNSSEIKKASIAYNKAKNDFLGFWEGNDEVGKRMDRLTNTPEWKQRLAALNLPKIESKPRSANDDMRKQQNVSLQVLEILKDARKSAETEVEISKEAELEMKLESSWERLDKAVDEFTALVNKFITSKDRTGLSSLWLAIEGEYKKALEVFNSLYTVGVEQSRKGIEKWNKRIKNLTVKIAVLDTSIEAELPDTSSRSKSTDDLPVKVSATLTAKRSMSAPALKKASLTSNVEDSWDQMGLDLKWSLLNTATDNFVKALETKGGNVVKAGEAFKKANQDFKNFLDYLQTIKFPVDLKKYSVALCVEKIRGAEVVEEDDEVINTVAPSRSLSPIYTRLPEALVDAAKSARQGVITGNNEFKRRRKSREERTPGYQRATEASKSRATTPRPSANPTKLALKAGVVQHKNF